MLSADIIRDLVQSPLTDAEAQALADWYANLTRGLDAFPIEELRQVEPPLRSMPGPP